MKWFLMVLALMVGCTGSGPTGDNSKHPDARGPRFVYQDAGSSSPDLTSEDLGPSLDVVTGDMADDTSDPLAEVTPTDHCIGLPPCPASSDPCVDSVQCDHSTGECSIIVHKPTGTSCDGDNDVCTSETCSDTGECKPTGKVETCQTEQQNNPCWVWICNKKTGCTQTTFFEGGSCDDGNACSINDTCTVLPAGKLCLGVPIPLDDGDSCTDDVCKDGKVTHTLIEGLCDVQIPDCTTNTDCLVGEVCQDGKCVKDPTNPWPFCDDGNPCTDDSNENGACQHVNNTLTCGPGATPCSPAAVCLNGTCQPGAVVPCGGCTGDNDCNDGFPDTDDLCSDGKCYSVPACEGPGIGVAFDLQLPGLWKLVRLEGPYIGYLWIDANGVMMQTLTVNGCKVGPAKKLGDFDYAEGVVAWPAGGLVLGRKDKAPQHFSAFGIPLGDVPGTGGVFMVPQDDGSVIAVDKVDNLTPRALFQDGSYFANDTFYSKSGSMILKTVPLPEVWFKDELTVSGGAEDNTVVSLHTPQIAPFEIYGTTSAGLVLGPVVYKELGGARGIALTSGFAAVYATEKDLNGKVLKSSYMTFSPTLGSYGAGKVMPGTAGLLQGIRTTDSGFLAVTGTKDPDTAVAFLVGDHCTKDNMCEDNMCEDNNPCTVDTCTGFGCAHYNDMMCQQP